MQREIAGSWEVCSNSDVFNASALRRARASCQPRRPRETNLSADAPAQKTGCRTQELVTTLRLPQSRKKNPCLVVRRALVSKVTLQEIATMPPSTRLYENIMSKHRDKLSRLMEKNACLQLVLRPLATEQALRWLRSWHRPAAQLTACLHSVLSLGTSLQLDNYYVEAQALPLRLQLKI
jgi:hypothetical protein